MARHSFGMSCSAQTRTYLSPEEVLKGLQGEIEEVLINISLSVNILKALYRAYDFCCANMGLFFKVRPAARAGSSRGEGGAVAGPGAREDLRGTWPVPSPPLPPERQGASALGIPFFLGLFQDECLLPPRPDHRGKAGSPPPALRSCVSQPHPRPHRSGTWGNHVPGPLSSVPRAVSQEQK